MPLRYLTVPPARRWWPTVASAGLGVMLTPKSGARLELATAMPYFACDSGCYTLGARFDLDRYLRWLERMVPARRTCLFAPAPDVVGDARATWARGRDVLPLIRALGYPAALVAQDGWEDGMVDWDAFDALFIGGTTAFKLAERTYALARRAQARGKHVHMGRVNARPRLLAAAAAGYDSADGTTMAYNTARYLPEVLGWLATLERQPALPGLAAPGGEG